jgi:hypothetical protein
MMAFQSLFFRQIGKDSLSVEVHDPPAMRARIRADAFNCCRTILYKGHRRLDGDSFAFALQPNAIAHCYH